MRRFATPLMLILLSLSAVAAAAETLEMDASTLFDCSITHNLRQTEDKTGIELEAGQLYEDDGPAAGYSYKPNQEKLGPGILIKKELLIPRPAAQGAKLLIGGQGQFDVAVNGSAIDTSTSEPVGQYWRAYTFDPSLLKAGLNEFVIKGSGNLWIARAEDFASGSLDRPKHPNRSARSSDGGNTWKRDELGPDGNIDGEYYVRVMLDQARSTGSLRSAILDLGNLKGATIAPVVECLNQVRIATQITNAETGTFTVRVRTGTTIVPDEDHWSDWFSVDGDPNVTMNDPKGRFLEFEVLFHAKQAGSPKLESVAISTEPILRKTSWTDRLKVNAIENPPIIRTSIPFQYEPLDHPDLQRLREVYELDKVVAGAESEFEQLERLAAWSATRWDKLGHLKDIYPAWNAHEILKLHDDGTPIGGFCQQYNIVFLQACESLGFVGRVVSIGPGKESAKIRSGHEAVEIWSNQFQKWIYIDGNTAWYAVGAESRVPLSLWELRERQLALFGGRPIEPIQIVSIIKTRYEWNGLDSWPAFVELRLVPRSNFLAQKSPLPLNQGMRGWFWTGHYAWDDGLAPALPLYSHRVSRRENLEWTLNQAHLTLEATDKPGELLVHVETVTPSLEAIYARFDNDANQVVGQHFLWKLHAGVNRLEATPRNRAGRLGIPSQVVVELQETE